MFYVKFVDAFTHVLFWASQQYVSLTEQLHFMLMKDNNKKIWSVLFKAIQKDNMLNSLSYSVELTDM